MARIEQLLCSMRLYICHWFACNDTRRFFLQELLCSSIVSRSFWVVFVHARMPMQLLNLPHDWTFA